MIMKHKIFLLVINAIILTIGLCFLHSLFAISFCKTILYILAVGFSLASIDTLYNILVGDFKDWLKQRKSGS